MQATKTARESVDEIFTDLLADIIAPSLHTPQDSTPQTTQEARKRDAVRLARRVAYL